MSIALADKNLVPVVGVVYNPATNELFSAALGQGATLNDNPIHVSSAESLSQSLLATGFPTGRRTIHPDNNISAFTAVLPRVRDMRRLGSAALELAFVACGRLEGFWEGFVHSWDVLAGLLIVTEAGGTISDYDGGTDKLYTGSQIVATNGKIHGDLLTAINAARG